MKSIYLACVTLALASACDKAPEESAPENINQAPATPTAVQAVEEPKEETELAVEEAEVPEAVDETHWVNLLNKVKTQFAATSAYKNDKYQISRMLDSSPTSSWNSKSFDRSEPPQKLTFRLSKGVSVRAIDMTVGYTSKKGTLDLFTANRRIKEITVSYKGESFTAELDTEDREVQRVRIPESFPEDGGGEIWTVTLSDWIDGSKAKFKELAISTFRVMGETASAPISSSDRKVDLGVLSVDGVEASEESVEEIDSVEESDEADAFEDQEAPSTTVLTRREGLHLTEMSLGDQVIKREIAAKSSRFSKLTHERVYCLFRLDNPSSEAVELTLAWEDADGKSRSPKTIEVPAQKRFTHYRYTSTSWRKPGEYRCVVRQGEEILGHASFELTE